MILVTGGAGFIGTHTVRALAQIGQESVVVQRSGRSEAAEHRLADLPVSIEQGDVADLDALRAIGQRHAISGIVHLAGYPAPRGSIGGIDATEEMLRGLTNIARVAVDWGIGRVTLASTIGVYGGLVTDGALREDMPVLLGAPHPIPRSKKIEELVGQQLGEASGVEFVSMRISGTWGPYGHEDPFFAAPALIHAAARREPLDLSSLIVEPLLGDGLDLCYVKDTARAIALLQTTDHLSYSTYNIGSGTVTTNADVIAAIETIEPGSQLTLPDGQGRAGRPFDIGRLHQDTGFELDYDVKAAAAEYIAWLRAGNER